MKKIIYTGHVDGFLRDAKTLIDLDFKWCGKNQDTLQLLKIYATSYYAIIPHSNDIYTHLTRNTYGSILAYCKNNYPGYQIVPIETLIINQSYQIF